jgi:serine/threonine-protein kinase
MAKDPEHRFRSARSFARELRQWLDENPTGAEGERTAPFTAPPAKRSRVVLGAAVAAGVAAVMAAVATWFVLMPAAPALTDTAATASEARSTRAAAADVAAPLPAPAALTAPVTVAAPDIRAVVTSPVSTPPVATSPISATDATIAVSLGVPPGAIASVAPAQTPTPATAAAPAATAKTAAAAQTTPAPVIPGRESAKDKKAREAREREARDNDARVAAAARLVAPATGTVKIAISPWGLVEVDGASSGAAPPITELTLAAGRHQIVVRNGDYAPHTVSIDVTAGQTISVRHKFGS